mmetsp:Transcript_2926/g.4204  ORF Transcript_2926/g.4204 Transcript_2926/m.4204 type:complete len:196 (-) Transcript_2926:1140-1727(-)
MMGLEPKERGLVLGAVVCGMVLGSLLSSVWTRKKRMARKAPRRIGGLCRLKPGMYDQYTQLHDHTWDEVLKRMYDSNIRNFMVYLHKETNLMFSHFEYVGDDFDKDMQTIDKDPVVRYWWSYCEPCQDPLNWSGPPPSQGGTDGEWWAPLECLNHCGAWPVEYTTRYPDPDFVCKNPHGMKSTKENPPSIHNNRV